MDRNDWSINLLSDVCVSSMDLFESLHVAYFGIGDLLYRYESNENCCGEHNNEMMCAYVIIAFQCNL